jgi:hypothetical protein
MRARALNWPRCVREAWRFLQSLSLASRPWNAAAHVPSVWCGAIRQWLVHRIEPSATSEPESAELLRATTQCCISPLAPHLNPPGCASKYTASTSTPPTFYHQLPNLILKPFALPAPCFNCRRHLYTTSDPARRSSHFRIYFSRCHYVGTALLGQISKRCEEIITRDTIIYLPH